MKVAGFDRREILGGLAMAAVASTFTSAANARTVRGKPNVLFIMADDLGYADLSCTGSHHIKTPNIDRIATMGAMVRQGYSNSSICSPTRTALLSGCYQYRFALGLEEPLGPNAPADIGLPIDRPTLASVFRNLGYTTHLVGKWHLGNPPQHGPLRHGYDTFLGVVEGAADYFRHRIVVGGKELGIGLAEGEEATSRDGYLTDVFGDEAAKIIDNAGEQPFLLSLHFTAPHWPWEGREDADVASALNLSMHYDGGSLAKYREMVEAMDQNVGKVLSALERTGALENTIIVFTSDNGGERFSETWPFIGVKGELLEGGIRVPILISWPQAIPAGSRTEQVMVSMDFLPTLLSMAGGHPASEGTFDGMDLSRSLTGNAPISRTLYWRFNGNNQAAIRDGDWKYLKLGGKEHLFDLSQDERERANLAQKEPAKFEALKRKWDVWNREMLPYRVDGYTEDVKVNYSDRY